MGPGALLWSDARLLLRERRCSIRRDSAELFIRENVDAAEFVPAIAETLVEYLERTGQRLDSARLLAVGSGPVPRGAI